MAVACCCATWQVTCPSSPTASPNNGSTMMQLASDYAVGRRVLTEYQRKTNKHGQAHRALKRRFAAFRAKTTARRRRDDFGSMGKQSAASRRSPDCNGVGFSLQRSVLRPVVVVALPHFVAVRISKMYVAIWCQKGTKLSPCACCAPPDVWTNLDKIRQDLEVEAHRDTTIESNLAMIRAHTDSV